MLFINRTNKWIFVLISNSKGHTIWHVWQVSISKHEIYCFRGQNIFIRCQWRRNEFESGIGGTSPRKSGGTGPAQSAGIFFLIVTLHFLALEVQLVVLVSAFVIISTTWSVSCLLFYTHGASRAQSFVKVGGTCPRALSSQRHCMLQMIKHSYTNLLFKWIASVKR